VDYTKIEKIGASSNLEVADVEASIACLHYILVNSAKNDLEDGTLEKELQQLGMPKEHSDSICRAYAKDKDRLQNVFVQTTLKLGGERQLLNWSVERAPSEIVETSKESRLPTVRVTLIDSNKSSDTAMPIAMSQEKFQVLLHELKLARALMDEM